MRYILGALFGILLIFLVFGVFVYLEHQKTSQRIENKNNTSQPVHKESESKKRTIKPPPKPKPKKPSFRRGNVTLYRWYDDNWVRRFSYRPPQDRAFSVYTYKPHQRLPKISKLPSRHITKATRRNNNRSQFVANAKQSAISQNNNAACRIIVGQLYETASKIKQHTGSRPSMWCENYRSQLDELRELRRDGHRCHYPGAWPRGC